VERRVTVAVEMSTILLILILLGALISVVAAFRALGAYLRFRRARAAFQDEVTDEVARLSARTDELEISLSALDTRAAELPIQISELQQSLTTLQILTSALGTSLRQVQKVLSYNALKTLSAARIGRLLQTASVSKGGQRSG
jgi:septal ring factor EnvC (AmiA/AmiB activator)